MSQNRDDSRDGRESEQARLRQTLESYMSQRKLRPTEQRNLIIDTFFSGDRHVTIESLLAEVQAKDPRIGYTTVYRVLLLLLDSGVAHTLSLGDGFTRYEPGDAHSHHHHLICESCGSVTEFENPDIDRLQREVAARADFMVTAPKHELYGICGACQKAEPQRPKVVRSARAGGRARRGS